MGQIPVHPSVTLTDASISQVLLHYLEIEGVDTLFGIPGAAVMDIAFQLREQSATFRYVVARHESGAAYMADGYARATGRLGVVVVTSGPGASNALTGSMNAEADGSPLLTITGEVASAYDGKGYLQSGIDGRLNIDEIFAAATDYSAVVTNGTSAPTLFAQALRDAQGLPHHAAHLSIPVDVQMSTLPTVTLPTSPDSYRTTAESNDPARVAQMFEALLGARYPLLMLGNACRRVLRGDRLLRFVAFVEKFGIPVITSADGKAVFPESNAWSLRNFGIAACEWPQYYLTPNKLDPTLPAHFDALAVLGSQLSEFATQKWNPALAPAGPLMQVDLDPSVIGRGYPTDLGIVAEVGQVIDELCKLGDRTPADTDAVATRAAFVARIKQLSPWRDPADTTSTASPVKPPALMKLISDLTPSGSLIFVDCANAVGWSLGYLAVDPPTEVHLALTVAPLGFGTGGVIGARMGRPDATCVALVGDGAFLMHGAEVSTAARYGVGAVFVVLDDNNLTMVNQGMHQFYPQAGSWDDYYDFNRPDLAMFAASLGADTYSVSDPTEFTPAYLEAIRKANADNVPQVIVVQTDPTLVPPFYPPASPPPPPPPPPSTGDRTFLNPPGAAQPVGPYNQGVKVGDTIYVSGQGAIDANGHIVLGSFEEQADLTFQNIQAILAAGGATMDDVLMVNIKLADTADFAKLNAVYTKYFPKDFPARCTAGTKLLFGLAIEVDCVAQVPV
ncbi:MAG: thiamine pyrophosphate-binding protein [Acidimicrobiia bacterium]